MLFSRDYIGYLSRQAVRRLTEAKMVRTDKPAVLVDRVQAAILEELSLEDRINEEVRLILEAYQDEMLKNGASYPEMFKKVKMELAKQYKAVLNENHAATSSTSWPTRLPTHWPTRTKSSFWKIATRIRQEARKILEACCGRELKIDAAARGRSRRSARSSWKARRSGTSCTASTTTTK